MEFENTHEINGYVITVGDIWEYVGLHDRIKATKKGWFLVMGFGWDVIDEYDNCDVVVRGYHLKSQRQFTYGFRRGKGCYQKITGL